MVFVNEFISKDDVVKYRIAEINSYYLKSDFRPHWTIDHDRRIYLRQVASGRDEFVGEHTYTLYWNGDLVELKIREKGHAMSDRTAWINYVLLTMNLPTHLEVRRGKILADLKDALVARNGSGVYSTGITTHATFDF